MRKRKGLPTYLRKTEEFDPEPIKRTSRERLGCGQITGVDVTIECGVVFLDGLDGAPKDSFPSTPVIGVWVEEADCSQRASSSPPPDQRQWSYQQSYD